ncbi:MAG: PEP-CTERM sorting domain-containing protein [Planctomycetota bacterium]
MKLHFTHVVTLSALTTAAASAAPLVSESFDYASGAPIAAQAGGSGWSGAWQINANATSTSTIVSGLTLGTYPTSGNALQIDQGTITNDDRGFVGRAVNADAGGSGTLFLSYLVRQTRDEGLPFGNGQDTFFGHSVTDELIEEPVIDSKFNGQISGSNGFGGPEGVDVAFGKLGNDGGDGRSAYTMPQDTTLLAIYAWEPVGVGNFSMTGDPLTATLWLLDESDYEAVFAAGLSIASLDANNQVKTVEASTIGSFGTESLDSGDLFRFFVQDAAVTFDEIRIGNQLSDVVAAPIPEPTSVAAIGLLGLVGLRRRR